MPSDSRDVRRWLTDILDNIDAANSFTVGLSFESFQANQLVFYAVTRCLEIISEASLHLPAEMKIRYPHIPWTEMAAAGNIYRHEYGGVDHRLIWGTVMNRLPDLRAVVEKELKEGA